LYEAYRAAIEAGYSEKEAFERYDDALARMDL
jgi:hypothetical protein